MYWSVNLKVCDILSFASFSRLASGVLSVLRRRFLYTEMAGESLLFRVVWAAYLSGDVRR